MNAAGPRWRFRPVSPGILGGAIGWMVARYLAAGGLRPLDVAAGFVLVAIPALVPGSTAGRHSAAGLLALPAVLLATVPATLVLPAAGLPLALVLGLWLDRQARLRPALGILPSVAVIAVTTLGVLGLVTVWRSMALSPDVSGLSDAEAVDRLLSALERAYAFPENVDGGWDDLAARYRARVEGVGDAAGLHLLVHDLLSELGDAHAGVSPSPMDRTLGAGIGASGRIIGEDYHAALVVPGSPASLAGLGDGDLILSIDGRSPAELAAGLPRTLYSYASPTTGAWRRDLLILAGPPGSAAKIVAVPQGSDEPVTLTIPRVMSPAPAPVGPSFAILDRDVRYLRLPRFLPESPPAAVFRELYTRHGEGGGWILDLRGNPGGSSPLADDLLRHLFDRTVRHGFFAWDWPIQIRFQMRVRPRPPTYSGPLVVVIDEATCSTAEYLARVLLDHRPGTLAVGRPTMGGTGNPSFLLVPVRWQFRGGMTARFSVGYSADASGEKIGEGTGVVPTHPVPLTPATLGWDAPVHMAVALLAPD